MSWLGSFRVAAVFLLWRWLVWVAAGAAVCAVAWGALSGGGQIRVLHARPGAVGLGRLGSLSMQGQSVISAAVGGG